MPKAKVNDINMCYELHGEGDPVVLIQGLAGNRTFWKPNLPDLIKRYRILLLDYRGAGDTDKPDMPYSTRMFADDIAALMEEIDFPRAHIVGRSMGGCIAQWLGIAHPDKVRSLFTDIRRGGGRFFIDRTEELFALLVFEAWWLRYMT